MTASKRLHPIVTIAKHAVVDEMRQRSFIAMFIVLIALVFLSRGCYQGNYMVNGQPLPADAVVAAVSRMTFHLIAVGGMLITALLSMRVLRRDRDDGMQSSILSKPIARWQYIMGKILGIWSVSSLYMFVLHLVVFFIASMALHAAIPCYILASLISCFNLLFVVVAVLLLSLVMPEFIAVLCVFGVGAAGLIIDIVYGLSRSPIAQTMGQQQSVPGQTGYLKGSIVYYVWPKLAGVQHLAASFIDGGFPLGSVYPLVNVLVYCLILMALLLARFRNEEIV